MERVGLATIIEIVEKRELVNLTLSHHNTHTAGTIYHA